MSFTQTISLLFGRVVRSVALRLLGKGASAPSFARFTLTKAVVVAEKVFAVEASDLFASFDVSKDTNARSVSPGSNKLDPTYTYLVVNRIHPYTIL